MVVGWEILSELSTGGTNELDGYGCAAAALDGELGARARNLGLGRTNVDLAGALHGSVAPINAREVAFDTVSAGDVGDTQRVG